MSYQVLARKWRPKDFKTLIGQEHVLRALINALEKQRLHHAYLFTGTRGVGKTTIARIFAKCLNCESGVTAEPCGQCSACQEIDSGKFVDLIEVDAASRTKVEDTRELLNNVQYVPTCGRFKVYLIDEVHMLSGHSFNALLKTLEEPPPHVKFLLATTTPQKLPVTILSRCLQFNLKHLSLEQITSHLQSVLQQENIPFESNALNQVARAANGSIRDSLSLLDQAIAFTQGNITNTDISAMLGTIEHKHIETLLHALLAKDGKQLLTLSKNLSEQAIDFSNVLEELISALHQIAIAQVIPDYQQTNALPVLELSQNFSKEDIQLYYQIALLGHRDLPLSNNPRSSFEMTCLRMLTFNPAAQSDKPILSRSDTIPQHSILNPQSSPTQPLNIDNWNALLPNLQLSGMTSVLASNCTLKNFDESRIELLLNENHVALLNEKLRERLNYALNQHFNKNIKLIVQTAKKINETPAEQTLKKTSAEHQKAIKTIESDPNVQAMIERFDITLKPDLIKPTKTDKK